MISGLFKSAQSDVTMSSLDFSHHGCFSTFLTCQSISSLRAFAFAVPITCLRSDLCSPHLVLLIFTFEFQWHLFREDHSHWLSSSDSTPTCQIFVSFFFYKKHFYLKVSVTERESVESQKERSSIHRFTFWIVVKPELGHMEAWSQEIHHGLPCWLRGQDTWTIFCCFPASITCSDLTLYPIQVDTDHHNTNSFIIVVVAFLKCGYLFLLTRI